MVKLRLFFAQVQKKFVMTITTAKKKAKELWSFIQIMWQLQRSITRRYGSMKTVGINFITKNHIRDVAKTTSIILGDNVRQQAFDQVSWLLQKTAIVHEMRVKVARARQLLYYMKNQFTNGIYSNKAKLDYLQLMYKKEIDAYRTEIAKSKDKKVKEMMKPLG